MDADASSLSLDSALEAQVVEADAESVDIIS